MLLYIKDCVFFHCTFHSILLFLSAIPALSLEHAVRQLEVIGGHGFDAIAIDAYLAEENGFHFI
jgi:hypothetical protein